MKRVSHLLLLGALFLGACSKPVETPPTPPPPTAPQESIAPAAPVAETPAVSPACAASLLPEAPAGSFRVASYNVRNWCLADRQVDGKYVDAALKPESEKRAVVSIIEAIQPDILALHEVGADPAMVEDLLTNLKQRGIDFPYVTKATGRDPRIQSVVFSKFPIVRDNPRTAETYTFKGETLTTSRGYIDIDVELPDKSLVTVLAAHLKSKRPTDGPGPTEADLREGEAGVLRRLVDAHLTEKPDQPLVVVGDFNDQVKSPAVQKLLKGLTPDAPRLRDLWLRDYLGDQWTHFFAPEVSYARIDYIVVNEVLFKRYLKDASFIYREAPGADPGLRWNSASDHRAVVATFSLPPKP